MLNIEFFKSNFINGEFKLQNSISLFFLLFVKIINFSCF